VKTPTKTKKSGKNIQSAADDIAEASASQLDFIEDAATDAYSDETSAEKNAPPVVVNDKVGLMLKSARLKKKLEVEDIAKKLCIRRVYLEAIEESDYEEIPDYPYGPGFVRSYADFLGLNGARLVQVFKEETNKQDKKTAVPYQPEEDQSEAAAPGKKYVVISVVLLVAIYLAWMFWDQYNNRPVEPIAPAEPVVSATEPASPETDNLPLSVDDYAQANSPATEAGAPAVKLPVVNVAPNTAANTPQVTVSDASFIEPAAPVPVVTPSASGVTLKVNQEVWVEVRDNDKLYLSKVLKPGETYALPNNGKNIKLSVGRVGAVDVFINGVLTNVITQDKKTNIDMNEFLKN